MPTNRKRRARQIVKYSMPDFVKILLLDGKEAYHEAMMRRDPGTGAFEAFMMLKSKEHMATGYKKYQHEIEALKMK